MAQTTQTAYLRLPKGARVLAKKKNASSFRDLGAIESDVAATLEWTDFELTTGNAGKPIKSKKDMKVTGSFNLFNIDPAGIEEISGGLFARVDTLATATTDIPNQIIPVGWAADTKYPIIAYTSSTDSKELKFTAKPTITSVNIDAAGTPEVLTEGTDYVISADVESSSGYSIQFIPGGISKPSPTTYAITIDFGSNTPIASTTIYCGEDNAEFDAYALKFTVYAEDGTTVEDELELFSTSSNSGSFNFGYKGAFSDGVDSMPIAFTADLDTTKTSGRQLLSWTRKA